MNSATGVRLWVRALAVFGACLATAGSAWCQGEQSEALYRDPTHSFEERAADLVARMTLEEKVSQLQNAAPAIPRLGVPAYDWWNEALHGVARAGPATVFPQAIGLAATFDAKLMLEEATAISDEARAKHAEALRRGEHGRYQGLTFWSPNINIFRDPRWGRGQETYGEDPYLTARMGVAFVDGMQGNDPRYLKLVATAKHYVVHSGPEPERHHFDVHPSEIDLHETYLPAFRALVEEAHVASVMGAYNRVNGESASASPRLLQDILRKRWGFKGYVVSDCDAVDDIFTQHKIVATAEAAAALALRSGLDLNCGKTFGALVNAVHQGLVSEADVDTAARRLMQARFELGMFDPPERVPWTHIPYSVNQSPQHDQLARRAAQASIVLLKNDHNTLPLSRNLRSIAVVGPTADEIMSLLIYARGADLVEGREDARAVPVIESKYLRPQESSSAQGLKGEYFNGRDFAGKPNLARVDPRVAFRWDRVSPTDDLVARGELPASQALGAEHFCVRWSGQLLPPVTGRYEIEVGADDGFRLYVDNRLVLDAWQTTSRLQSKSVFLDLQAGTAHDVRLEYFQAHLRITRILEVFETDRPRRPSRILPGYA